MKKIILIFILFALPLKALEITCNFEEAYSNGDIQQGLLLIKKDKLRYEYSDENLYTLLYVNQKVFLINNTNTSQTQLIENHNNLLPSILEIYDDFPNFKEVYIKNNYEIKIEKGSNKFIKRLIVKSKKLNVSVYFINCKEALLEDKLFNFNPFYQYVPNKI